MADLQMETLEPQVAPTNKNSDAERGKFRSLTLINWNGFFARTFDLDDLVTTLSGGNGAGKSTTMAGFVTALIPDLTLLHFRNTTEAGASGGSRDKGLYGKLRPGVCYAILDTINSHRQRALVGVRLQQIAGRDRKVDIKAFSVQGLSLSISPTEVFTDKISETQAKVIGLNEVKEKVEQLGAGFKQYHSVADYHSFMFDMGIIPKRLRSSSDRSKFYKLIEASLYGGISSAITRSLRDYLLPENVGVKKAFQDMEVALRENRMTLEAIKVTQADRDLFKHLITQSTDYVAADYMRHANERRHNIEAILSQRHELFNTKQQLNLAQHNIVDFSREVSQLKEAEKALEIDYQSANDHYNLVVNAQRHQEKIERYQQDVESLTENIEEQQGIVEEAQINLETQREQVEAIEEEIESIRDQLADYQQALNAQQTRSVQYQQAVQTLEKAKNITGITTLTAESAEQYQAEFEEQAEVLTERVLELEQKLSVADIAKNQFDKAYQLVCKIHDENVERDQAYEAAKQILRDYPAQKLQLQQANTLKTKLSELQQKAQQQRRVQQQLAAFNQQSGQALNSAEMLEHYALQQEELGAELEEQLNALIEQRSGLRQQRDHYQALYQQYAQKAPLWLTAQAALERIQEQVSQQFQNAQSVMDFMQVQLNKERELVILRDQLQQKKEHLEQQILRLTQPDGSEDPRLNQLAEKFSGVLLSELYDDVDISDAPYFSALYGPARHAIVVRDLEAVKPLLQDLQDCPDDLYLIEGDPNAFDDSVLSAQELNAGVVVQVSERELRYSTFPEIPLFGRAAREKHLETLREQRDDIAEQFAQVSFDVQKCQRLHQQLSQFVGSHLALAFEVDPEELMREVQQQRTDVERELAAFTDQEQQLRSQIADIRQQLQQLNKLLPHLSLLEADDLEQQIEAFQEQLDIAEESAMFVRQKGNWIEQLEPITTALQSDPEQHQTLQQDYQRAVELQKLIQQKLFAVTDVVSRLPHFAYQESVEIETSTLSTTLRERLEQMQQQREQVREALQQAQHQCSQYQQVLTGLTTSRDVKQQTLQELLDEVAQLGVRVDTDAENRAKTRRDELYQQLSVNRQRYNYLEKQLAVLENESDSLSKSLRKLERDYKTQREMVVMSKISWCAVQRLSRHSDVEKRLHRRELAYLSAEELRSMSDKALGALRNAVADNEYLRDALRLSEDSAKPENKVKFFIAVYQHLRERIRQDILKTDDPIDAIEQMEVELSRLTEELTSREQKLAISADSVANIMRKTIQREQNRIRLLNQGLQNIAFGQVKSVRLVVNIRDTHAMLLDALSGQKAEYEDLFNNNKITFSEALAKLYQRLNPHIDMGQRSPQTIGEELLDYRHYLDLEVEVFRGADGWLRAESGALSTGEAIGTGMSILLMVVQSWEEESRRLRGKDIIPCRLLFLDEAARLDAKSISTLFELCDRLDMQLLIAAPENISPEKGTTYKLVRKIAHNQEFVHVVGLKGFGV